MPLCLLPASLAVPLNSLARLFLRLRQGRVHALGSTHLAADVEEYVLGKGTQRTALILNAFQTCLIYIIFFIS